MASHHYVPQWHQKLFFKDNERTYFVLDTSILIIKGNILKLKSPKPKGAKAIFEEEGLYRTLVGGDPERVEKIFFGEIDNLGSNALYSWFEKKNSPDKLGGIHLNNSEDLFSYISALSIRTPKGLGILKKYLLNKDKEAVLDELQKIHFYMILNLFESHIEIFDVSHLKEKFIISDHPVVFFNPFLKEVDLFSIFRKGTQIIVPLSKNYCFISTNLEYAEDFKVKTALDNRTNPRIRDSVIVRNDKLSNIHKIDLHTLRGINQLQKENALKTIAGCNENDLFPENKDKTKSTSFLKPTTDGKKGRFMQFDNDGKLIYTQDQYGRKPSEEDFAEIKKKEEETYRDIMSIISKNAKQSKHKKTI